MIEIKTLTDRVNRHSFEQKENFDKLFDRLDAFKEENNKEQKEIIERIHALEIKSLNKHNELNAKIVAWTGLIGSLGGALSSFLYQFLKK